MTARSHERRPQPHQLGSQRAQHARQPDAQRLDAIPPAAVAHHARQRRHRREGRGEIAYSAAFVRQSDTAYVVRDLDTFGDPDDLGGVHDQGAGDVVVVPKHYAVAEPFPAPRAGQVPGTRLLRWSTRALLAAVCGGLGGILLGGLVTLVATVQLQRFARRVRRWRRRSRGADGNPMPPALPAAASAERLRLLTAWVQGMLAILLGVALLALILWHLL
jgi:hypothetical protein